MYLCDVLLCCAHLNRLHFFFSSYEAAVHDGLPRRYLKFRPYHPIILGDSSQQKHALVPQLETMLLGRTRTYCSTLFLSLPSYFRIANSSSHSAAVRSISSTPLLSLRAFCTRIAQTHLTNISPPFRSSVFDAAFNAVQLWRSAVILSAVNASAVNDIRICTHRRYEGYQFFHIPRTRNLCYPDSDNPLLAWDKHLE